MNVTKTISVEAIVASYTNLLVAWNEQNAPGFAAQFAEHATVIGFDGSQMNGRNAIESELARIFTDHPTARYVAKVREIRPLDEQTVLLRAVVGMVPRGKSELNPAVNSVQSLVFVQGEDGVRIELLQNTPAAFHGRPQLVDELTGELTAVLDSGKIVENA